MGLSCVLAITASGDLGSQLNGGIQRMDMDTFGPVQLRLAMVDRKNRNEGEVLDFMM